MNLKSESELRIAHITEPLLTSAGLRRRNQSVQLTLLDVAEVVATCSLSSARANLSQGGFRLGSEESIAKLKPACDSMSVRMI